MSQGGRNIDMRGILMCAKQARDRKRWKTRDWRDVIEVERGE